MSEGDRFIGKGLEGGRLVSRLEALEARAALFKLPPDEAAELAELRHKDRAYGLHEDVEAASKRAAELRGEAPKHTLRSWAYLYTAMVNGEKLHDLRINDRNYAVGDVCLLQEYDNTRGEYTGREALFRISYITGRAGVPCAVSSSVLARDHVILSMQLVKVLK